MTDEDTFRCASCPAIAKRAEHRGFIRGLEAARRIAARERREFGALGHASAAYGCEWIRDAVTDRIAKERKKVAK